MEIYDTRIKYFGEEDAKGTILAFKTYDYLEMMGSKADQGVVYDWLGEAIGEMKGKMYPLDAYSYYMVASLSEYLNDNSKKRPFHKRLFHGNGIR